MSFSIKNKSSETLYLHFDKIAPAVPEQTVSGPKPNVFLTLQAICQQEIKTIACLGQKIQKIEFLLEYQGYTPEGPKSTLTFVFQTPTHISNIITIHSELLKLC